MSAGSWGSDWLFSEDRRTSGSWGGDRDSYWESEVNQQVGLGAEKEEEGILSKQNI